MKREDIFQKLGEIANESSSEAIDWSKVDESTGIEALGFDSLTILDLLFEMEEAFDVEIKAKEILAIGTVGELLDFVEHKRAS